MCASMSGSCRADKVGALDTRFELRIFRDRLVLSDQKTGRQIDRTATESFSTNRLLVADINSAGDLLKSMISEILGTSRLWLWPSVTMVPMELCEDTLTMVELMGLRKLGEDVGFRKIFVHEAGHAPYQLSV